VLPRSLQQALPQDNQLILLSDIQAFSDHKAGHTISSPLGGREALQTPSPWQQWSWASDSLYRERLKQYLHFLEPRQIVPRGPQDCASPALTDRNSHITDILILGAFGLKPVSFSPHSGAGPGLAV